MRRPTGKEIGIGLVGLAVALFLVWDMLGPRFSGPEEEPEKQAHLVRSVAPEAPVSPPAVAGACATGSPSEDALLARAYRDGRHRDGELVARVDAFKRRLLVKAVLDEAAADAERLSEAELRAWYREHRDRFVRPQQIRVQHFHFPGTTDGRQAAEALAAELAGKPDLALQRAAEVNLAAPDEQRAGDLGFFSRGRFGAPFDEPLFALSRRGQTALVEHTDGWHLFVLMDIRQGREFAFDEVQDAVRDAARAEARNEALAHFALELSEELGPVTPTVTIPGGSFWMGSTEDEIAATMAMARRYVGQVQEPELRWYLDEDYHLERVRTFALDRTEVTRGQYEHFVAATNHEPLPDFAREYGTTAEHPAVGVTQTDAAAYCAFVGKRLPTAAEWEYAARGVERRRFPWGDEEPDGSRANYGDQSSGVAWRDREHDDGHPRMAPVGSYPEGATPEGLLDMGGNAREWTASAAQGVIDPEDQRIYRWQDRQGVAGAAELAPVTMYLVKGGGWDCAADDLRTADIRMLPPDMRKPTLGFRCARDL